MSVPRPDDRSAFRNTPNAERYLLEADSLRRRQLRAALLHGTARTWRDRRRVWPATLGGLAVTAVIVAVIAVYGAFQQQQQINQQQKQRNSPVPAVSTSPPAPTPRPTRTRSASPRRSQPGVGGHGSP
jgi:hypothetical protein